MPWHMSIAREEVRESDPYQSRETLLCPFQHAPPKSYPGARSWKAGGRLAPV